MLLVATYKLVIFDVFVAGEHDDDDDEEKFLRSPARGGSTIAVILGDTTALSMVGKMSSALPQWNSTLVKPDARAHTHAILKVNS